MPRSSARQKRTRKSCDNGLIHAGLLTSGQLESQFKPIGNPQRFTQLRKNSNGEIKRCTNVVGIFPNEAAITRLIGAILLEQNDEWAVQRARYMTPETMEPLRDNPIVMLSAVPGA